MQLAGPRCTRASQPQLVDEILGSPKLTVLNSAVAEPRPRQAKPAGCSCGSGIPTSKLSIGDKAVDLLALPLIFQRLHELGRAPEAAADELLETVKVYNAVPPGKEEDYRTAITREYAAFCQEVAQ